MATTVVSGERSWSRLWSAAGGVAALGGGVAEAGVDALGIAAQPRALLRVALGVAVAAIGGVDVLLTLAHALPLAEAGPLLGVALPVSVLVHAHATRSSRLAYPATDNGYTPGPAANRWQIRGRGSGQGYTHGSGR